MKIVSVPVATRNISKLSDGMVAPWASIIIGTRRTMPSRSGLIVNSPRPAAAASRTGTLRSKPGQSNMKGCGSSPSIARPVNSRDVRIEPVGLGEYDVERDHDGTEPGQTSDQIRDPGPRPGKLPEFRQARFVDIDNGDRPCRLHARVDALEAIEGSDAKFLDGGGIGDAQRRKPDQECQAHQPGIPEPPLEPPS